MKKSFGVLFVLCLAMVFVCSCQNGTGSDDIAGGALYKVNLSVELPADGPQRTISVSGGSVAAGDLTYWYKATPNWTAGDAFGKTDEDVNEGFVQITSYAANKNIGRFQQGQWTFDVQVKSDEDVVYAGTTTLYINAANTSVTVGVTRDGEGVGTGTIGFGEITAARVNETLASNKVRMEYGVGMYGVGEEGEDWAKTAEQTVTCAQDVQNLSFMIDAVEDLPAGNYWVKLTYLNNTSVVGSVIDNFTLDAGQTRTFSGYFEEGIHQIAFITINGISSLSLSEIESDVTDGVVTFTCEANPDDDVTYQWYKNGEKVNGATGPSFEWTPDAYQYASITCTATRGNIVVSKSTTYQVTELP